MMLPRFPLYIPSKGRADSRITMRTLQAMGVPFHVVVEQQDVEAYAQHLPRECLLVLDPEYKRKYDVFDGHGLSKSTGPGPARNFAWQHSIDNGHAWHWVMDDNIQWFYRLNRNRKVRVLDGAVFRAMEDFCLRYTNIAMAGPNYEMFVPRRIRVPPFTLNTRIYSCNLIRNDVPWRWRGRYNEDTDLSLRMLKGGWCTVQFNAVLQNKLATQIVKGGNTGEFYAQEGTLPKSMMQVAMHPDISRLVWKFGRWHHHVDYRVFKQRLQLREGVELPSGTNEYGLRLVEGRAAG